MGPKLSADQQNGEIVDVRTGGAGADQTAVRLQRMVGVIVPEKLIGIEPHPPERRDNTVSSAVKF